MIPQGNTFTTITNLKPATTYEFQVVGKNALGDGMLSKIITARTLGTKRTYEGGGSKRRGVNIDIHACTDCDTALIGMLATCIR